MIPAFERETEAGRSRVWGQPGHHSVFMSHKIHFSSLCNSMIFTALPRIQQALDISFQLFSPSKIPHPHWQLSSRLPPACSKHELCSPPAKRASSGHSVWTVSSMGLFYLGNFEDLSTRWQWVLSLLLSFLSLRGAIFSTILLPKWALRGRAITNNVAPNLTCLSSPVFAVHFSWG